jgi:signal transduction histidine kinase
MDQRDADTRAASRRLLATSEREFQRIVLDMHDGPVQDIFAALSQLQVLERALAADPPPRLASAREYWCARGDSNTWPPDS